jgi:phenylacetate-CoA ligase
VERTLLAVAGIAQLQLVQQSPTELTAYAVLDSASSTLTSSALARALKQDLGEGIQVRIEQVARIPQEKNGKYRFALRKF